MRFYLILVLALASFAAIFIIQNVAAVDVNFLFWTVSMNTWGVFRRLAVQKESRIEEGHVLSEHVHMIAIPPK